MPPARTAAADRTNKPIGVAAVCTQTATASADALADCSNDGAGPVTGLEHALELPIGKCPRLGAGIDIAQVSAQQMAKCHCLHQQRSLLAAVCRYQGSHLRAA